MCNFPITKLYIHKMIPDMAQQALDKLQKLADELTRFFQTEAVSAERASSAWKQPPVAKITKNT